MNLKVAFRVDASTDIGSGHVMRCLVLADCLRYHGAECYFICRDLTGNMIERISEDGFNVVALLEVSNYIKKNSRELLFSPIHLNLLGCDWQDDANQTIVAIDSVGVKPDWLIVDSYSLDVNWESALRNSVKNIMAIDDLADREHDCDILLDQNYYTNMKSRYAELVPSYCEKYVGPQYLLLRNEFRNAHQKYTRVNNSIERIFMFFGGGDASHETLKALDALSCLKHKNISVDVVVGKANIDQKKIKELIESIPHVSYHFNINNMAELMINADLAVIAAGGCVWETCYLSLPTITIMTAQNQFEAISSLGDEGIVWNLGWNCNITSNDIAAAIDRACQSPKKLTEMGTKAKQLIGNSNDFNKLISAIKYPVGTEA